MSKHQIFSLSGLSEQAKAQVCRDTMTMAEIETTIWDARAHAHYLVRVIRSCRARIGEYGIADVFELLKACKAECRIAVKARRMKELA